MIRINIAQAKARFSEFLKRVESGETVVVSRRNTPIAEIKPLRKKLRSRRPIGLCAGEFHVPEDFNAPLPEEILQDFEGR